MLVTVLHAQCAFGELRGHTEETGQYHPECRTRPTQRYRDRNTGNIAQPDRAGQCRGQCLEMGYLTGGFRVIVITTHQLKAVFEGAYIYEIEIKREYYCGNNQPDQYKWNLYAGNGKREKYKTGNSIRERLDRDIDFFINPYISKNGKTAKQTNEGGDSHS